MNNEKKFDKDNLDLEKLVKELSNKLNKSEKEARENWELFVRAKAEIENITKRTEKKILDIQKYSQKNLIIDLLPILDSFDSCLENDNNKNEKIYTGINLLYKMLISVLNRHYVKKINVEKYSDFDPQKHEVISIIDNDKYDNKILSVFQSGYLLHNRVIRYSKVSILKINKN